MSHRSPDRPSPPAWHLRPALFCITLYQKILSPMKTALFGPAATCRFSPTCSQYAREAVLTHGLFKGTLLALARILRCQPLATGGHNPVPPKGHWRSVSDANRSRRCNHNHG